LSNNFHWHYLSKMPHTKIIKMSENTEEKETGEVVNEATTEQNTETAPSEEAKVAELNDKYLRLYSDFDNFRKRSIKEKNDAYKNATSDVFKSFLPTLDDFDRALKSVETATDIDSLREGINLIHSKLLNTLKQKGLAEMEAQSKDFDADYHEAITEIPAPSEELKGKVVDVVEKGYMLDGKIIRYAKVIVGK
jgi:molecular chaperone GrpE